MRRHNSKTGFPLIVNRLLHPVKKERVTISDASVGMTILRSYQDGRILKQKTELDSESSHTQTNKIPFVQLSVSDLQVMLQTRISRSSCQDRP